MGGLGHVVFVYLQMLTVTLMILFLIMIYCTF
jgi:hypothetical protein